MTTLWKPGDGKEPQSLKPDISGAATKASVLDLSELAATFFLVLVTFGFAFAFVF